MVWVGDKGESGSEMDPNSVILKHRRHQGRGAPMVYLRHPASGTVSYVYPGAGLTSCHVRGSSSFGLKWFLNDGAP